MKTKTSGFNCHDCGQNTHVLREYYMVTREVWEEATQGDTKARLAMLCIGCLEKRLGRTLTPSDFPPFPINTAPHGPQSPRLLDRMYGDKISTFIPNDPLSKLQRLVDILHEADENKASESPPES